MYKIISESIVQRLTDGMQFPTDPANTDYAAYLAWLAEGNTPEPSDSTGLNESDAVTYVQSKLDTFARDRGYDGIMSACTYATSKVPKFRREGQRAVDIRDATWHNLYIYLGEIQAGTKPMPTALTDIDKVLPPFTWI